MSDLPEILPVFPLSGVLLLPSTRLPLHVFEARYRAMVEDALEEGSPIGMIQPLVPADDHRAPEDEKAAIDEPPELYRIGCAGAIQSAKQLEGGRWIVLLKGLRRFRVDREVGLRRGYRRVVPDWSPFAHDGEEQLDEESTARLLEALERFGVRRSLDLDFEALEELPGVTLLDGVSAALPFEPAERQALLEAEDAAARLDVLLGLMEMDAGLRTDDDGPSAPN